MTPHFFAPVIFLVVLSGCGGSSGPRLVAVHGTVTLDGKPVPDAVVVFTPETGRPSSGVSNTEGQYELVYAHDQRGAVVGTHKVKITTGRDKAVVEGKVVQEAVTEKIPKQYNVDSTLTANVSSNESEINFELSSK